MIINIVYIFLIGVSIQINTAESLTLECSDGWVKIYERCYMIVPYTYSWTNARDYCNKYGARLAEPAGYTITDALSAEVTKKQIHTFWIGYNRLGSVLPGYMGRWSDGRETGVDVGVWPPYQPNGECATIVVDTTTNQMNRWYMTSCYHVLPFVCERNPCPDDTFTCSNGNCVAPWKRCNNMNDCGDQSDEQGCDIHDLCWIRQEGDNGRFEVTPDNYYISSTYCLFTIQTTIGQRIRIKFGTVDLEEGLDLLEIWDGGPTLSTSTYIGRVSGQSAGPYNTYISSTNTLLLVFITDTILEKQGFTVSWTTDFPCEILLKEGFSVATGTIGYSKLLTDRQDVGVCSTECERSSQCWGFQYDTSQTIERSCYFMTEAPVLSRDSCCDVYVNTCPNNARTGADLDIPTHPYALTAQSTPRDLYTPLYPFAYIGNFEQTHLITVEGNRLITLQIVSVELCCTDSIHIHDGDGPDSSVLAVVDGHYTPRYIISSSNHVYIYMNLQQHWQCMGVLIKYMSGCDVTMTDESGIIQSPGYDVNVYPDVMTCSWLIQPSSGDSVQLTFTDFQLEDTMDILEVYRGFDATGEVAHTGTGYTGLNIPDIVTSTVGLYVRFTTSAVNGLRGFSAEYSAGCPVISSQSLVIDPISTSYFAPDKVTITCAEGYLFAGSFQGEEQVYMTCQKDGSWSRKNLPLCERQYCGLAPTLPHGYIVTASGVRGGDVIQYECDDDYTMIGDRYVQCYSNSTWGPLPECIAEECSDLAMERADASFTVLYGNGREHGSVVSLTCPPYYQLIGPQTVICKQGEWKTEIPKCQPIPCHVPALWNGYYDTSRSYVQNSTVHVICDAGYTIAGSTGATTDATTGGTTGATTGGTTGATDAGVDGYYQCDVDTPLTCDNVNECLLGLDDCENAVCVDSDGNYTCECMHGYIPNTENVWRCDDVDECTARLNTCEYSCDNLPGSYLCSCNTGYDLYTEVGLNGHNLLPLEDGTKPWHAFHLNHSCVLKACTPDVIESITFGKAMTSRAQFFYGDSVEFICNIGYYVAGTTQGSMNTTCTADGTWTLIPACEEAYCEDDNIDAVVPKGRISYEDRYTLKCMTATGLVVLQRQCGYDKETGQYTTVGPNLVCPDTICDEPPVYTGMRPFVILSYVYESTIVFECEDQYIRRGESTLGNYLVPCGSQGSWEFGTLRCEGGQCPDPGYPVNGQTHLSSWNHINDIMYSVAIGSVATFTCNQAGYVPEPSANATCRVVGIEAAWDKPVPVCVDKEPPAFVNCLEDTEVEAFSLYFFEEPYAIDNTAVKSFQVYPENFHSGMVVDTTRTHTYIAEDYNNNQAWCQFRVKVKDHTSPELICKLPDAITASDTDVHLSTGIYLTYDDPGANIVASPDVVTVNYDAIGTNPIVTFAVTDPSGNLAVCSSQMRIDAPACTPDTLHVYNGEISCTSGMLGYECVVTCLQGYYFYEDPAEPSIRVKCSTEGEWSRAMPTCTAKDLAHFQYTIRYKYQLGDSVQSTCAPTYVANINDQLLLLTNALTALCDNATQTFDVSPSDTTPVTSEIQEITRLLETKLTVVITPHGLADNVYQGCADAILKAFNSKTSAVQSVHFLDGGPFCAQINMKDYSAQTESADFACTSNAEAVALSGNLHICLACPPGTYSSNLRCEACMAGTYNDGFYKDECTLCPPRTSSKMIGARYIKECYEDCGVNMYSTTGKAPCTDCPVDTYYVNNTYCSPCPRQTHTRGRGAVNEDQCIEMCPAGYFSRDGLQPCSLCPRHFYQSYPGSDTCSECPSFRITLTEGSDSSNACTDSSSLCNPNPCNGGSCMVVRHDVYCNCSAGFTGRLCETSVSPCDVHPCLNGGHCMASDHTTYTCTCQEPYSGTNCEEDVDHCTDDVCENNGTCIDQNGDYMCACASHSGYHGDKCQYEQSPCIRFPCQNNGQCEAQGSYNRVCRCPGGFSGVDCEFNEDECASNPCMNNAACTDDDNMFVCTCPHGYTGLYCHLRNREAVCDRNACMTGIECIDNYVANSRHCICHAGWYYSDQYHVCALFNDIYCENVDCGDDGSCITYDGGYHTKCQCSPGYAGTQCHLNVDDCIYSPCNNDGTCVDSVNDYTCSCPILGTGGPICEDIVDGCLACVPANTLACTDRPNSYTCYCKPGYFGENCQNIVPSCEYFPCQHGGSCTNLDSPETHICICQGSWTGNNCEEELDICTSGGTSGERCMNGGTCISTSRGYVCECPYNYIGEHCDELYDQCNRTNPCVGESSECVDTQWGIQCSCEPGYSGDSCETMLWYCADNTCHNGGTCDVINNVGIVCACLPGYAGIDCSINIDECLTTDCPENADCVDGINEAVCVCHDGKVGESCEKDIDRTFDYLIQPSRDCAEQFVHPMYTMDNAAFTLFVWVRATVVNGANSIISLFGVSTSDTLISEWQYRLQVGSQRVRFDLRQGLDSQTAHFENNNIGDGLWHKVAVTWSNEDGFLSVYIDNVYDSGMVLGAGRQFSSFGYVVLGEDSDTPFIGRMSRINLLNERLSEQEVSKYSRASSSVPNILPDTILQAAYRHTFTSDFSKNNCFTTALCNDRAFNASMLPSVSVCTSDTLYTGERISTPVWETPVFLQTIPESRESTTISGETVMSWGSYGIGEAEYSVDGDAAVCTFRLYNKRTRCSDPIVPSGVSMECQTLNNNEGKSCEVSCKNNNEELSEEAPVYYTCSKYGMWNHDNMDVRYQLPPCSASVTPQNNLSVHLEYNTTQPCDNDVISELDLEIKNTIKDMNTDWYNGFCRSQYGDVDSECDVVEVMVWCREDNVAAVDITFPYLEDTVGSASNQVLPQDAFKLAYRDWRMFEFQSVEEPDHAAFTFGVVKTCPVGYQLLQEQCVLCGSGLYYDMDTATCTRCPTGTYRTVYDTTSPTSQCTPCTGSDTTSNTGSPAAGYCHVSCFLGNYYNEENSTCMVCPVGFYNDVIGSLSCTPCSIDKSTRYQGSTNEEQCILLTELYTTTSTTDAPSVGASTEEELSPGVIAAIVLSVLITITLLLLFIFLCVTNRLPCMRGDKKIAPAATSMKYVNRYGETNMKYINFRLSDLRDHKSKDTIPMYNTPEPAASETTIPSHDSIAVQVPVFMEVLGGTVNKKHTFISTRRASDTGESDFDRMSERPTSTINGSMLSDSVKFTGTHKENGHAGPESNGSVVMTTPSRKHRRSSRHGRPPADLSHKEAPPRQLSPIRKLFQAPNVEQTSEYIRPPSPFSRQRAEVTPAQYEDFLTQPVRSEVITSTPPPSQNGSDKILLDSDDEDLR